MEKYEDIRSSVNVSEDLWREASDSTISLPAIENANNSNGKLEGGLLEYDNIEMEVVAAYSDVEILNSINKLTSLTLII